MDKCKLNHKKRDRTIFDGYKPYLIEYSPVSFIEFVCEPTDHKKHHKIKVKVHDNSCLEKHLEDADAFVIQLIFARERRSAWTKLILQEKKQSHNPRTNYIQDDLNDLDIVDSISSLSNADSLLRRDPEHASATDLQVLIPQLQKSIEDLSSLRQSLQQRDLHDLAQLAEQLLAGLQELLSLYCDLDEVLSDITLCTTMV